MDIKRLCWALMAVSALTLGACSKGGGDGNSPPPPPPQTGGGGDNTVPDPQPEPPATPAYSDIPQTDEEAARFLTQASFGVTRADIQRLRQVGYAKWIDDQLDPAVTPVTTTLDYFVRHEASGIHRHQFGSRERAMNWLWSAIKAPDQLRMRIGLALSEILVVSEVDGKGNLETFRNARYQDLLAESAHGSYRDLLEQVTTFPAMGYYLSHAGNRKADPAANVAPDENYAREIMQLFSIGLVQLNQDGTPKLDAASQPIPTYDQDVITGMARVFTGWTYAGVRRFNNQDHESYVPMECHPEFHDDKPKTIFNGIVIDEGNDCRKSLARTIDALAAHPNTAPFVSRQLIQRFVTSNPSPAYVKRVADVWNATEGNIGKVVKAILLDNEARIPPAAGDAVFGKAREPLVNVATIYRAFNAQYEFPNGGTGRIDWGFWGAGTMNDHIGQESLRAPTVFNFFEPGHRLPGNNGAEGIQAPEFQIINEATYMSGVNYYSRVADYANTGEGYVVQARPGPTLNLAPLIRPVEAGDYAAAIEELNLLLMYGRMSPQTKDTMSAMATGLAAQRASAPSIAHSLLVLAVASPEFAIQR